MTLPIKMSVASHRRRILRTLLRHHSDSGPGRQLLLSMIPATSARRVAPMHAANEVPDVTPAANINLNKGFGLSLRVDGLSLSRETKILTCRSGVHIPQIGDFEQPRCEHRKAQLPIGGPQGRSRPGRPSGTSGRCTFPAERSPESWCGARSGAGTMAETGFTSASSSSKAPTEEAAVALAPVRGTTAKLFRS